MTLFLLTKTPFQNGAKLFQILSFTVKGNKEENDTAAYLTVYSSTECAKG